TNNSSLYFSKSAPGRCLQRTELTSHDIENLSRHNDFTATTWSVTSCIVANILAPALRQIPIGIAYCGVGADYVSTAVARTLGCRSILVAHKRKGLFNAYIDEIAEVTDKHNWPNLVLFHSGTRPEIYRYWLADDNEKNVLVAMNWYQGVACSMTNNW